MGIPCIQLGGDDLQSRPLQWYPRLEGWGGSAQQAVGASAVNDRGRGKARVRGKHACSFIRHLQWMLLLSWLHYIRGLLLHWYTACPKFVDTSPSHLYELVGHLIPKPWALLWSFPIPLLSIIILHSSSKAFHKILEGVYGNLCPFCEVRYWCQMRRPGSQSMFPFIP